MFMNPTNEKRETVRLTLDSQVHIVNNKDDTISGKLKNLSATGALLATDRQLQPGSSCNLSITLQGDNSNLVINDLAARVVRCNGDGGAALEFVDKMEWLTLFYVYGSKFNLDKA